VTTKDIEKDYHLSLAKLELQSILPELSESCRLPDHTDIISLYLQQGKFENAMITSNLFGAELGRVFKALVERCLDGPPLNVFVCAPPIQRNYLYLDEFLKKYDKPTEGYPLSKEVIVTFLSRSPTVILPDWLTRPIQVFLF
jgi:hypothetical protein